LAQKDRYKSKTPPNRPPRTPEPPYGTSGSFVPPDGDPTEPPFPTELPSGSEASADALPTQTGAEEADDEAGEHSPEPSDGGEIIVDRDEQVLEEAESLVEPPFEPLDTVADQTVQPDSPPELVNDFTDASAEPVLAAEAPPVVPPPETQPSSGVEVPVPVAPASPPVPAPTTAGGKKVADKPPVDTRTKNESSVDRAIAKEGRHLGRFRDMTLKAESEKRSVFTPILNVKYTIHPRPGEFKDGTVWHEFLKVCKELASKAENGVITGQQIAEACVAHNWTHIQRAKYTLKGVPADGWILSLIQGGPTSKYRILKRVEG